MGIALNHPPIGSVGWAALVDANWATLEDQYVARQAGDTSVVTVTGTTAETALMANTTIPADGLGVGTVLDVLAAGNWTIPANSSPTITWRLRWGGTLGVVLATWTWLPTTGGSSVSGGWITNHNLVGVSAGLFGSVEVHGWFANASFATGFGTSAIGIATTSPVTLLWTVQSTLSTVSISQRLMVVNRG